MSLSQLIISLYALCCVEETWDQNKLPKRTTSLQKNPQTCWYCILNVFSVNHIRAVTAQPGYNTFHSLHSSCGCVALWSLLCSWWGNCRRTVKDWHRPDNERTPRKTCQPGSKSVTSTWWFKEMRAQRGRMKVETMTGVKRWSTNG